ncbi:LysM peptidoglycan-binding domain-containing protein [Arthrobacter mobilis]|uniref:LysM peptidoglycan-binding domain-containing protein n=1 Tax=Arthrobacter mobilis TaxID=2724944 RepID=A0A7X6K6V9_9MICC|nr:LysM peptidoglycan-binding domain-containing protein [Arthrobacter mobilis]NKX56105.1 LysM peptidoglycan-binding domain-containing protein [Arthrobacter mobilis]
MSVPLALPKPPAAPLRLTRRGRLVLAGLPLMLGAAAVLLPAGALTSPANAAPELPVPETVRITVGAGQTLWDIATLVAPERHPHEVIAEIAELNNLEGTVVQPGQQVFVPSSR